MIREWPSIIIDTRRWLWWYVTHRLVCLVFGHTPLPPEEDDWNKFCKNCWRCKRDMGVMFCSEHVSLNHLYKQFYTDKKK